MKKKLAVFLVAFFAIFAIPHNAKAYTEPTYTSAIFSVDQEVELTNANWDSKTKRFNCRMNAPTTQSIKQAFRLEITGATEGNIGYIHCSQFGGAIEELPLDITWENGKAYATTPSLDAKYSYKFYINDEVDPNIKIKVSVVEASEVPEFSGSVSGTLKKGLEKSEWHKIKIEKSGDYILTQQPIAYYGVILRNMNMQNVKAQWSGNDERKGEKRTGYYLEPGEYYVQVYSTVGDRITEDINYTISLTPRNSYITGLSNVEMRSIDTIQLGEGRDIFFTTIPADSNDGVIFESSNPTIAEIKFGTQVYFLKKGQVQLTAKNGKGDVLGTWILTISNNSATFKEEKTTPPKNDNTTKPATVKVTKIKITGPSTTIAYGKSIQLSAQVTPTKATNKKVTWSSSNSKYATVSSSGKVTTKKAGKGKTVTITAKAKDGSNKKATYKIKIANGIVTKVKISGKNTLKVGKTLGLKAKVSGSKGAYKKVIWTSSNKKYATVSSSGKVKALKAGKKKTVTITAKAIDGSGKKATIKIKIK